MLILQRMPGETIEVGPDIEITLLRCGPEYGRLMIRLGDRIIHANVQTEQSILIDGGDRGIEIRICRYVSGQGARIGIQAPIGVEIRRGELPSLPARPAKV